MPPFAAAFANVVRTQFHFAALYGEPWWDRKVNTFLLMLGDFVFFSCFPTYIPSQKGGGIFSPSSFILSLFAQAKEVGKVFI